MKLPLLRSLGLLSVLSLAPAASPAATVPPAAAAIPMEMPHFTYQELLQSDSDFVVAVAENRIITAEGVRVRVDEIRRGLSGRQFDRNPDEFVREAVNEMINDVLIVKEFEKDGKRRIPDSYIDDAVAAKVELAGDRLKFLQYLKSKGETMPEYRQLIKEQIIVEIMEGQFKRKIAVVSPEKMEEYYQAHLADFIQEDAVRYRTIEFAPRAGETDAELLARAQAAADRIKAGEAFATVANELNPRSAKTNASDPSWTKLSELSPVFSDAIAKLDKGKVSDPILSTEAPKFCLIFYLVDRRTKGTLTLAAASPAIERELGNKLGTEAIEKWIKHLRDEFYWRIY